MAKFPFIQSLSESHQDDGNEDFLYERYSENNSAFLRYMKAGDEFDPYRSWSYVCIWCEKNHILDEVSELVGEEISDAFEMMEFEPDIFYKLDEDTQKEIAEWASSQHMTDDPADAPTTSHMMLNRQNLLPRTTWLAHFTDAPYEIWHGGFTKGMDQMDRLGLTTMYKDEAKKYGGYNFAFVADGRHAQWAASEGKYGTRGVMLFQNSGVHCYHYGDEEDQVVFWGADVDPKHIIMVTRDHYDWHVHAVRDLPGERGDVLFKGDYKAVVKWVMQNHRQYAKLLYGR